MAVVFILQNITTKTNYLLLVYSSYGFKTVMDVCLSVRGEEWKDFKVALKNGYNFETYETSSL